jgi:hypothetical protein
MAKSDGKSILHYGCIGCGVVLLVVVVLAAGVAGFAWLGVQNEDVAERSFERRVPPVERPGVDEPDEPSAAESERTSSVPLPEGPAGRVVLDLSGAEFRLRPGGPDEPLGVRAVYDLNAYRLEQEDAEADDGSWVWRVRFERSGGWLTTVKELLGGTKPEVEIVLPPDVPIALDARVAQGALEAELGGLWLTEVEFDGSMGACVVEIDEPSPVPVERFVARGSMGGWVLSGIANLSPAELTFESEMGGSVVDLRGDWRRDAAISLRNRRGGMQLVIDREAIVTGLDGVRGAPTGIEAPRDPELPVAPTLAFQVTGDLEDIQVQRR